MTDAEEKLLDLVTEQFKRSADDGYGSGYSLGNPVLDKALREILLERLPPEYEQSLKSASYRAWDALEVMDKIRSQHALGSEFVRRLRLEWKAERGITE
jgi:hypothetical protein